MNKIRIPTLQHMARNWFDTPEKVEKAYLQLAKNTPMFSYAPLNNVARDCLLFRVPEEQIAQGIVRKEKREKVKKILLEILPLLCGHLESIRPDFVHEVGYRHYPLGRELRIPFKPPLLYGVGGQLYFPWFSYWKSNPLDKERLSLFVTLVEEMLQQDPELENARFQILDFSVPSGEECRQLRILEAGDIPKLNRSQKQEMLNIFVDGFQKAQVALSKMETNEQDDKKDIYIDTNQLSLLD